MSNPKTTQDLVAPPSSVKYYTNCRGANYLPILKSEWEKSGYLPRIEDTLASLLGFTGHSPLSSFQGTGKAAQWYYYNREDTDLSIKLCRSLGMNSIRVFLDIFCWNYDKEKYKNNLIDFFKVCDREKIRVQLVIWDGIHIGLPQQTFRDTAENSMIFSLRNAWTGQPQEFEVSSQPAAENFFTTCATPYINDIASSVSGFQSLWSFDLKNEASQNFVWLASATGLYLKTLLSSVNTQMTFGHGAGWDPYDTGPLVNSLGEALGTGPGGSYLHYPNFIYQLSNVLDIATLHPYGNNAYYMKKLVTDAVSGSRQLQAFGKTIPSMYNELHIPEGFGFIQDDLRIMSSVNFGGMGFDALIDYAVSYEPFRDVQGVLFADGTARNKEDAETYIALARNKNWFSDSQLRLSITEKGISTNGGLDGGYWSGVTPELSEFNPNKYTKTDFTKWTGARDSLVFSFLADNPANNPNFSKNYPAFPGHPMSYGRGPGTAASGITFRKAMEILYTYDTYFPALSSMPNANSGSIFMDKNSSVMWRTFIIDRIQTTLVEVLGGITYSELRGSIYDKNPVPLATRYEFSAAFSQLVDIYYPVGRPGFAVLSYTTSGSKLPGSPVAPGNFVASTALTPGGSTVEADGAIACWRNSNCLLVGGGEGRPSNYSDIDWAAYDVIFKDCVTKLKAVTDVFLEEAETNNDYNLFRDGYTFPY
jgi:hypothetical protein